MKSEMQILRFNLVGQSECEYLGDHYSDDRAEEDPK